MIEYSIAVSSLTNGLEENLLHQELLVLPSFVGLSVDLDNAVMVLHFNAALDAGQIATRDAVLATHVPGPVAPPRRFGARRSESIYIDEDSKSSSWRRIARVSFAGPDYEVPIEVQVLACAEKNNASGEFRLTEPNNGTIVCVGTISSKDMLVVDASTPVFPNAAAVLELQVRRTAGSGEIYIETLVLTY